MANFERKVLVLDSRYEPVKVVSMETGFVLIYTERAIPIVDSDREIKGISNSYKVPWIVKLNGCSPKGKRLLVPRLSRQNIYLRDGFRCQYCNWSGPLSNLSLDHIIPSARGGKTTWENLITACKPCNLRKGSKTIEELGIKLKLRIFKPQLHPAALFIMKYGLTRENVPTDWRPFIDLSFIDQYLPPSGQNISLLNQQAS